ncbi:molybdenum cofactor biosynthesis protein MoaE [Trichothermofontia sp.]
MSQGPAELNDRFAITFAPLSLSEVYELAVDPASGAVVVMSGTVRDHTDGKAVVSLEYQAYEPMALRVFAQIAADLRQQWPMVNRVVIYHRTGHLTIGETSVLVAVSCPHRAEAFAACQYAIDTLKHNAPIWKKEHWADGASTWVSIGACEPDAPAPPPAIEQTGRTWDNVAAVYPTRDRASSQLSPRTP